MLSLLTLFVIRLAPGIAFQSVAVAAPVMASAIGLTHARLGLLLGAFMLPGIAAPLLAGVLARWLGDRTVLFGALVLIALGALAASQAGSYAALLPARIVEGAGGAAVLMLIIKMTTDRYTGRWLSTASAFILTAWPAGLALGLLLLGPAPIALGWQATFGLAGVPAVIGLPLLLVVGRSPTRSSVATARHADGPPLSLVLGASLSWSFLNGVLAIIVGFLPGYLVSLGRSVPAAASATSLAVWSSAIMIPFGGFLADRVIGRRAAVIGGLAATAGLLATTVASAAPAAVLVALGVVFSAVPGPLTAQLGEATPPSARAIVFGWYSAASYTGMTLAPSIAGWLGDASADARTPLLFAAALSVLALAPYAIMDRSAVRLVYAPR